MQCPICKKPIEDPHPDDTNPPRYYPFCSERCKLIDLGRWLSGRYQIPVRDDDDERDAPPPADTD